MGVIDDIKDAAQRIADLERKMLEVIADLPGIHQAVEATQLANAAIIDQVKGIDVKVQDIPGILANLSTLGASIKAIKSILDTVPGAVRSGIQDAIAGMQLAFDTLKADVAKAIAAAGAAVPGGGGVGGEGGSVVTEDGSIVYVPPASTPEKPKSSTGETVFYCALIIAAFLLVVYLINRFAGKTPGGASNGTA